MAEIHQLIVSKGLDAARTAATTTAKRALVDIAANILAEESEQLGITYAGWCLTGLPHKRLPDETPWQRKGHRLTLLVEPGYIRRDNKLVRIGVPYGSRARLILLYLQTKAIQTNSREVELGRSMREWLDRMGVSVGGKTYQEVRAQADRISACHMSFFWDDPHGREGFFKSSLVTSGIRLHSHDARQGDLWQDTVTLSAEYFAALQAHPVPVWEPALREINNRSMSLDIYVWLAYRLHALSRPMSIGWATVQDQFGAGFAAARSFRPTFKEALAFALAVYPDAKVEMNSSGLVLHPSRPPIDRKTLVALPGGLAR
jgi:hypothetical protein